ncbi:hypothetical protein [Vulcanisaeta distributa]|uniref:hypothetical protein n=1 Tax=Vulcanisaeta distributa TaxID=164451 RepID=UPI000B18E058|nr:hypothetical protein [Vulcanisaeta distributa]
MSRRRVKDPMDALIWNLLNEYGINGPMRITYYNFARELIATLRRRSSTNTLMNITKKYLEEYGADSEVMMRIVKALNNYLQLSSTYLNYA